MNILISDPYPSTSLIVTKIRKSHLSKHYELLLDKLSIAVIRYWKTWIFCLGMKQRASQEANL